MDTDRFLQFTQRIDAIQKAVQQIKLKYASIFGVKSIYLFWLCELLRHPAGLTPITLAKRLNIDRSLVSREIGELKKHGYISCVTDAGKRNYNTPIILTERGRALAERISEAGLTVQRRADFGLDEAELSAFYQISQKLLNNLTLLAAFEEHTGECNGEKGINNET